MEDGLLSEFAEIEQTGTWWGKFISTGLIAAIIIFCVWVFALSSSLWKHPLWI